MLCPIHVVLGTTELTGDPWDHGIAPGLRMLWSYPGAAGHAIDPAPVDVYTAFKANRLRLNVQSPAGLDLRGQVRGIDCLLFIWVPVLRRFPRAV